MRRINFLAVAVILLLTMFLHPPANFAQAALEVARAPGECFVYVGTYTDKGSKGIYVYRMDLSAGKLSPVGLAAETPNPTFLDIDPLGQFLYAANEISRFQGEHSGAVSAFKIDAATGKLTLLNQVSSQGDGPCHILVDRLGKYALVANYGGGTVAVIPIQRDGQFSEIYNSIQFSGHGIVRDRQDRPHAHCMALDKDNHFAFACDLGTDKVMSFHFDPASGKLTPNETPFFSAAPGAGPRHLAFSADGRFAYLINELSCTMTSLAYDSKRGEFHELQTLPMLPDDFKQHNLSAEVAIHPNGKFLYGSNRGHDSIAVFAIDPATGELTFIQRVSTEGKTPRHFALTPAGDFMVIANQDSNNLVVFTVDAKTGKLQPTGQVLEVASPVCVKFLVPSAGRQFGALIDSPILR